MSQFFKQKNSSFPSKLSSQQYTHLTVKQIKQRYSSFQIDLYTPIQNHLQPLNKNAHKIIQLNTNFHKRQQMIFQILNKVKSQSNEYQNYKNLIKEKIQQSSSNISDMQSRKNTFSIDCLREIMSFPLKVQKDNTSFNFTAFFRQNLDKQMRRLLWCKMLITQSNKKQFFTWNHQITPYNVDSEFRITLQKIAQQQKIKLKQSQKDMGIKLLQYGVKKHQIIPSKSQTYSVLSLIQLFSHYLPTKINDLGAIYCGLQNISTFYYEPNVDQRIQKIFKALQLVDQQSHQLIRRTFLHNQQIETTSKLQLNQIYENFRLSLGAKFLPLSLSQYYIDQLLIKKKNKFDMYVLFAITILVLGDHIQKLIKDNQNKYKMNSGQNQDNLGGEEKLNIQAGTMNKLLSPTGRENNMSSPIRENTLSSPIRENKFQNSVSSKLKSKQKQKSPHNDFQFRLIFENSKQIIKKQDILQAFQVVYEKIPASYSAQYQIDQPNKLFQYLLLHQAGGQMKVPSNNGVFGNSSKIIDRENEIQVSQQQQLLNQQIKKWKRLSQTDQLQQDFVRQQTSNIPLRLGKIQPQNKTNKIEKGRQR